MIKADCYEPAPHGISDFRRKTPGDFSGGILFRNFWKIVHETNFSSTNQFFHQKPSFFLRNPGFFLDLDVASFFLTSFFLDPKKKLVFSHPWNLDFLHIFAPWVHKRCTLRNLGNGPIEGVQGEVTRPTPDCALSGSWVKIQGSF